jgi:hypothetical protein
VSIARGALGMGRSLAETLMTDTVRIFRRVDAGTVDEDGEAEYTDTDLFTGPARLVLRSGASVSHVDAQSQLLGVQSPRLDVPIVGTGGVRNGDRFEITASLTDSGLVGLAGVVAGMFPQTYATARRLPVEVAS